MNNKSKNETVSLSFHYLAREKRKENGDTETTAISQQEFDNLFVELKKLEYVDMSVEQNDEKIRYRQLVIINKIEKINTRLISGIYKTSYWGHSYENSVHGKIPADSINFRPFYFLLYLSDTGRVYLASQYLGNYGGYGAIRNTVTSFFNDKNEIVANSFNFCNVTLKDAKPKSVEIKYSRTSDNIIGGNTYTRFGSISFKKMSKNDGFEDNISKDFLAHSKKPQQEIKKTIAEVLQNGGLMDAKDIDIEDCVIVVQLPNNKRKYIHLLDESSFATRFPVDVRLDKDGHPEYEPLKKEAQELLTKQIISKKENV